VVLVCGGESAAGGSIAEFAWCVTYPDAGSSTAAGWAVECSRMPFTTSVTLEAGGSEETAPSPWGFSGAGSAVAEAVGG
jgi:hypothetical protein